MVAARENNIMRHSIHCAMASLTSSYGMDGDKRSEEIHIAYTPHYLLFPTFLSIFGINLQFNADKKGFGVRFDNAPKQDQS